MSNTKDYEFENFTNPSEKGFDTVVLQLGSHSIKFGYSSQLQPFIIPNCIAYNHMHIREKDENKESMTINSETNSNELIKNSNLINKAIEEIEIETIKELSKLEKVISSKNKASLYQKQYYSNATTRNNNHLINSNKADFTKYFDLDVQEDKELLMRNNLLQFVSEKKKLNNKHLDDKQLFIKINNTTLDINEDLIDNNFRWSSFDEESKENYLIGRDALSLSDIDLDNYSIHFPIKYGYFNSELQPYTVINDLHKILSFCFFKVMRLIPYKETDIKEDLDSEEIKNETDNCNKEETVDNKIINNNDNESKVNDKDKEESIYQNISDCNLVLIIPDLFIKTEVKMLLNLFFKRFRFKNIITHTESVMTSYGSALQNCCVVDVGATKTSVCCIEEGIIIKESYIKKHYGGNDIDDLLLSMLVNNSFKRNVFFPMREFNLNSSYYKKRIIEKLKEDVVEFPNVDKPTTQFKTKLHKLWLYRKGKESCVFNLSITEECYLSCMLIYFPDIINIIRDIKQNKQLSLDNENDKENKDSNEGINADNINKKTLNNLNNCYLSELIDEKYVDPEDGLDELIDIINNEKKEEALGANKNINNNNQTAINNIQSLSNNNNNNLNFDITSKAQSTHTKSKKTKNLSFKINLNNNQSNNNDDDSKSLSVSNTNQESLNQNESNMNKKQISISNFNNNINSNDNKLLSNQLNTGNTSTTNNAWLNLFDYKNFSLHEIIAQSIMTINNPELRKKFANSIILTGGVTKTQGFIGYLEEKLISKLCEHDSQMERVEVINLPTFDGKTLTWIGASVLPKLETTKELWISRDKWIFDINLINSITNNSNNKNTENKDDKDEDNNDLNLNENKDKDKDKDKEKSKQMKRRREKTIETGISYLRQKTPYVWSYNLVN